MSYIAGYEILEGAFDAGIQPETARLGDVFLSVPGVPDLSVPIGHKIEKTVQLSVPTRSGQLALAITCRVVRPDVEMCADVIELYNFSPWVSQPNPNMTTKQIIDWGEGEDAYQSRVWTGFSRSELEWFDKTWQRYEQELGAWQTQNKDHPDEVDVPNRSAWLIYKLVSEKPQITPQGEAGDFSRHFEVLSKVASLLPVLGYIASGTSIGSYVIRKQSPEQFTAFADWLLR